MNRKNFKLSVFMFLTVLMLPVFTSAQLTQQWAYRYSGIGSDGIKYQATKVDAAGNLYVAGYSENVNTGTDILIMKFIANSAGYPFWVTVYTGLGGSGSEIPYALTLDNSGNIYITGSSWGGGSDLDVITLKYNNSGQLQWVQRYNGAYNGPDWASCITLDASGNVVVAGRTETSGSGTHSDYLTIKYSSSGVMQWVRTYDGPSDSDDADEISSIAADGMGNVIVTGKAGWTGSGYDIVNIKYTPAGVGGATRYDGLENDDDEGIKIVADYAGNYYVTGTTKENNSGNTITTIKFATTGLPLWTKKYNFISNGIDQPADMEIDGSGVYITGYSLGNGTNGDYITIKYSTAGTQLWASRLNGPGNSVDEAHSIAIDNNANVYVTGVSIGNGSGLDIATVKYNSSGVQIGNVMRYNGPYNYIDWGASVEVNSTGSFVYVSGWSFQSQQNSDIMTIKYSQPVGLNNSNSEIPENFELGQNYPNPFNPITNIEFSLTKAAFVKLVVHDITGREIKTLVSQNMNAGVYKADWDGSNHSSGVYFYTIEAGEFTDVKKMILVK